jgi:phage/plasmid-like protein (TIGR03299 family)
VNLRPVVALSDEFIHAMENEQMIDASKLLSLMVPEVRATVRTDTNKSLGVVSSKYGVVQNSDAFKFVDMFCSGKFAEREDTPCIETCGVLGNGERVFVSAKFTNPIVLNAKMGDLAELYVMFTTTHDGTGSVRCVVTPVRVVCNNTLRLALASNQGSLSFRHSSNVMNRLDLLNKENAKFAYSALNLASLYEKEFKETYEHLRNIKLSERDLDNILAEITLSAEAAKVFKETRNIESDGIATKGRNIFIGMKESLDYGIGQDITTRGTAEWALNGITSFYQNKANFKSEEVKFDSILDGTVQKKVQRAYEMMLDAA